MASDDAAAPRSSKAEGATDILRRGVGTRGHAEGQGRNSLVAEEHERHGGQREGHHDGGRREEAVARSQAVEGSRSAEVVVDKPRLGWEECRPGDGALAEPAGRTDRGGTEEGGFRRGRTIAAAAQVEGRLARDCTEPGQERKLAFVLRRA